jgi:two-component system chemotaxis sensor kinase CheA
MADQELMEAFVAETQDLLDEVEPKLIELQRTCDATGGVDAETLGAIFRLFHSMKGGAGFLGLTTVAGVTHEAETLLDLFRKGKMQMAGRHTQSLCKAIDLIRELLQTITNTGSDAGHEAEASEVAHELKEHAKERSTGPKTCPTTLAAKVATPSPRPKAEPDANASLEALALEVTPEMRTTFCQESKELLETVEQCLLSLEKAHGSDAQRKVSEAFRAMHSFKGNCGFMNLADMQKVAHRFENVLEVVKAGKLSITPQHVTTLMGIVDSFQNGVHHVRGGGNGNLEFPEAYIDLMEDILNKQEPSTKTMEMGTQTVIPVVETKEGLTRRVQTQSVEKPNSSTKRIESQTQAKGIAAARQDVRVDLKKLDQLIDLVGELVIAEAMVTRHPKVIQQEDESLERSIHLLRRVSRDLQDTAMSVRMIPLSATFRKMIRLVHDLAGKMHKEVELKLVGEDTEVDKTVIEALSDPLVHLVRNAVDHGIEMPADRSAAGKPRKATVTIEGRHEGGEVWILISDDGRGLDKGKILKKAKEKGLIPLDAQDLSDDQAFKLIFEAGFSTAAQVTDVSGRGVGMDVVKKNLEKLKGRIDVRTKPGQGSTFILRIPLTLAIIEGMLVRVGQARYTIPLLVIRESFRPDRSQLHTTPEGDLVVRVRDDFHPVIRLSDRFRVKADFDDLEKGILIVVEDQGHTLAILVDEILGQQETVIKGLSHFLGTSRGVSGCTILGDGSVSLILDVGTLIAERA